MAITRRTDTTCNTTSLSRPSAPRAEGEVTSRSRGDAGAFELHLHPTSQTTYYNCDDCASPESSGDHSHAHTLSLSVPCFPRHVRSRHRYTARQRLAKTRVTTPLRIRNYTLTHTSHSQYTHLPAIPCPLVCPLCASRLILFSTLTPLIPPTTLIITKQSTIHLNHARTRPLFLLAMPDHTIHLTPCPLLCACLPAIVSHIVRTTE